MKGYQLTFSTLQSREFQGKRVIDHLAQIAKEEGLGITIMSGAQGRGRDGEWRSASFFELADQPLEAVMNLSEEECERLFRRLEALKMGIFYTKIPIEYGIL